MMVHSNTQFIVMRRFFTLAVGIFISSASFAQDEYPNETNNFYIKHTSMESALKAADPDGYVNTKNDKIIAESSKNIETIKKDLGDNYGGYWIEYDSNKVATIIIGVAGNASRLYPRALNNNEHERIIFRTVNYGLSYLSSLEEKITEIFRNITQSGEQIIFSSGVDEQNNRVFIRGRKRNFEYIAEVLRRAGFDLNIINIEEQNGPTTLMSSVYSGTKIVGASSGDTRLGVCTTGFHVVFDGFYQGSITAAHCKNNGVFLPTHAYFNLGGSPTGSSKGALIGEFFADGWPDRIDAILFGNTNFAHTLERQIITGNNTLSQVNPLVVPGLNSRICTSGGSNGWRCGSLTRLSVRHLVNGRDFFFGEFSACGGPGDSGGPVVTASYNAVGIYSGSPGNVPGGTCGPVFGGGSAVVSIYQPLGPYFTKFPSLQLFTY
ncbi:S1 family peptidase [Delftia acidovorans]|uniref:S1 family peptidase n=1 Tax=Delftia acidovorans TaxID=80866 RepID=UPI002FDE5374